MTLRESLLWDVLLHPEDDLPRLVYADYLLESHNERDRARGEFIQLQIALHKANIGHGINTGFHPGIYPGSINPLIREAAQLLKVFEDEVSGKFRSAIWSRGFLHTVRVFGYQANGLTADLFRREPIESVLVEYTTIWIGPNECGYTGSAHEKYPWENERYGFDPQQRFATDHEAREAYSRCCVAWGREQAGLLEEMTQCKRS